MTHLSKAIFEAAAWIMYARLRVLKVHLQDDARLLDGDYGVGEINPYWAGLPEIENTYSRYAMQEKPQ